MKRSLDSANRNPASTPKKFSGVWLSFRSFFTHESLFRTVVLALVFFSILPLILYGTVSYYRTRSQIQSLVAKQLDSITRAGAGQFEDFARNRGAALDSLLEDGQFSTLIKGVLKPGAVSKSDADMAALMIKNYIAAQTSGTGEATFDLVMLLDQNGNGILSTDEGWMNKTFSSSPPGQFPLLQPLVQKGNSASLIYNPFPPYEDRFALVTVRKFKVNYDPREFSAVAISSSRLPILILRQATAFFEDASAYYYFQSDKNLISFQSDNRMTVLQNNPSVMSALSPVIDDPRTFQPISFVSFQDVPVLAHVAPISDLGLYLVVEVPTETLFGQVPFLDTFNIYILLGSIAILILIAYLGTTQVVNPLVHLSTVARGLAGGNFQLRARVNRRDEVGGLAESINHMAQDLDTLYSSLEEKVAQRARQLRTASEIAQLATSSANWDETLGKAVELINQRFDYYHTAIYLVDETGTGLFLKKASGEIGVMRLRQSRRTAFSDQTLVANVALNKEAQVTDDLKAKRTSQPDDFLPDGRSEAAIPILIGNEVLGVLNVFSSQPNVFDPDTVSVLKILTTQVANAMQITRLLATAQFNLEETSLLYQVTRQIIEAPDEAAITQIMVEVLPQIPHTNAYISLDGSNLHILGLFDASTKKYERTLFSIDIPVNHLFEALVAGKTIFIDDISQPSDYDNVLSFFLRRGCKSAAIFPMLQNEKISKVLILGFREDERVDQNVLQPFSNLAEVLSTTLGKFAVLKSLQQHLNELEILANFSKASSAETDLVHIFRILHQQITNSFGEDIGFLIALINDEKDQIEIPYAFESNELISLDPLPMGTGLTSFVIQTKTPLLLTKDTERRAIELGARIVGKPARSWMGVPLIVGGDLIGALILQDQLNDERFTQSDLDLFTTLAPQIATAIRNAQLVEDMQKTLRAYDDERLLINTWLEHTPDLVIVKNLHGQYIRTSKSISQFFDVPFSQAIGKTDFDLMKREKAEQTTEQEIGILQEKGKSLEVLEKSTRAGKDAWFISSKIPVIGQDGQPTGLLTIRRDVTEMKQAEDGAHRRASEVLTAAEIAREATSTLNIEELLEKVVNLIRDRFGFYHASIFLLDPLGQFAVLRESTGEAGRRMLETEHKLAVGSKSIVGQASLLKEAVIVGNVTIDPTYYPNPLLPNTRAELAIPLKISGNVLGVLDVQSTETNIFTQEDISILGILADQLAIAVNNAELFARTQDMLGKHRLLHQITIAASTSSSLGEAMDRVVNGLVIAQVADRAAILLVNRSGLDVIAIHGYDSAGLPANRIAFGQGVTGMSAQERHPILVQDTRHDPRYLNYDQNTLSELALPILFGDEIFGVLNMESNYLAGFDLNDQEIMVALVNNLGALIANWRLVNQIRHQVERQQFLFNAAARIRRSVDIATIMQTSVNEIGLGMGVQNARLTLAQSDSQAKDERPVLLNPGGNPSKNGNNAPHSNSEVQG